MKVPLHSEGVDALLRRCITKISPGHTSQTTGWGCDVLHRKS